MNFEFATATRVIFGHGRLEDAGPVAASWGGSALVVTGARPERADGLLAILRRAGVEATVHPIGREPTISDVAAGAGLARQLGVRAVIALGGGSAMDAGKAVAALATNPGDPLDYLEVIGRARPLGNDPLPFMAIPTTAGTGAEVTRNAVLTSEEHRVKVSLRSPRMLPRVALVDPDLTLDLPPDVTATTGLDAMTQLLEALVSSRANPMTDVLCRDGLNRAASALPRAFVHGGDRTARADMALAALYSGMALANAGLGAVHGFAGPLGGRFRAPHGAICAALLAPVTATNLEAIQRRDPDHPALLRFAEAARCVTGRPDAVPGDLVAALRSLVARLKVPGLARYGVTPEDFPELARQAQQSSSMKGNPVELSASELHSILVRAL